MIHKQLSQSQLVRRKNYDPLIPRQGMRLGEA